MKKSSQISITMIAFVSIMFLSNTYVGIGVNAQTQSMNQTSQKMSQPQMNEKILNYTNFAIIALDSDEEDVVKQNLLNIQQTILNSTDKEIVIVPSSAVEIDLD